MNLLLIIRKEEYTKNNFFLDQFDNKVRFFEIGEIGEQFELGDWVNWWVWNIGMMDMNYSVVVFFLYNNNFMNHNKF